MKLNLACCWIVLLVSGAAPGAEPWTPGYDELPRTTRAALEAYAKTCFFYKDAIWVADAEAMRKRDANVTRIKGRSYIANSNLTSYTQEFEQEQHRPPVAYDIANDQYVSELRDDMAEAQAEQRVTGKGPDLLTVTGEGDDVKRVTGKDLWELIGKGSELPRFVGEKAVHDKAVYTHKWVGSGNTRIKKKVLVKPATYKVVWKREPHRASLAATRALQVMRRNHEAAIKRLLLLEKNLTDSLREDLTRSDDAERLIVLYVFEADDPKQATNFLPVVDDEFAAHIKLAQRDTSTLSPAEALKLGDWCYAMSEDERYRSVKQLKTRAARCYELYLASEPEEGEDRTRAEERAKTLGG